MIDFKQVPIQSQKVGPMSNINKLIIISILSFLFWQLNSPLAYSEEGSPALKPLSDFFTIWSPENGQHHPMGQFSSSINPYWIKTWTVPWNSGPGILMKTSKISLASGKYAAIFQIWHKLSPGKYLGELRAYNEGTLIAKKDLISSEFLSRWQSGYQREVLELELTDSSSALSFELYYSGAAPIWIGVVSLTPTENKRPFYNIGHHCNTTKKVDQMIKNGANSIEFDLTPFRDSSGKVDFWAYHAGDLPGKWTKDIHAFLRELQKRLEKKELALIVIDCKQVNGISAKEYVTSLVEKLMALHLSSSNIVLSIPSEISLQFKEVLYSTVDPNSDTYRSYVSYKYPAGIDVYFTSYQGLTAKKWIELAENSHATLLGLGADALHPSTMASWLPWLQELINKRDADKKIKKAYCWTVNRPASMRLCLDYLVDGILTDHPENLSKVLNELPYKELFRKAATSDLPLKVFGFESL